MRDSDEPAQADADVKRLPVVERDDFHAVAAKGLSATATAARNLRGIDVTVTVGERALDVKLAEAEPDARYSLCVQTNWLTATAVTEKRSDGFHVVFAEAAPPDAKIDWQLIR